MNVGTFGSTTPGRMTELFEANASQEAEGAGSFGEMRQSSKFPYPSLLYSPVNAVKLTDGRDSFAGRGVVAESKPTLYICHTCISKAQSPHDALPAIPVNLLQI